MSREQLIAFVKSGKLKDYKFENTINLKEIVELARANGYDVAEEDFKLINSLKTIVAEGEDAIPWKDVDGIFAREKD